jgi:hypothetical protein
MLTAGLTIIGNYPEEFGRDRTPMKPYTEIGEGASTFDTEAIEAETVSTRDAIRSDGSSI